MSSVRNKKGDCRERVTLRIKEGVGVGASDGRNRNSGKPEVRIHALGGYEI